MSLIHRLALRVRPPVLALGGGGARGFAHVGFLEVVDEARVPLRAIAGTSMGAVVGAMYLALGSAEAVRQRWREALDEGVIARVRSFQLADDGVEEHPLLQAARRFRDRVVISVALNRTTMFEGGDLEKAVDFLVPDLAIEDLPMPFVAVATDLDSGEEVRLDRGSLRTAVRASSSIPGLLPAVTWDVRRLVDGGTVAEVPVAAARALGRPVVAVDVSMELPPQLEGQTALHVMMRTQVMTSRLLRNCQLRGADAVVRPAAGHVAWSEWDEFDELVENGRRAAREWLSLSP